MSKPKLIGKFCRVECVKILLLRIIVVRVESVLTPVRTGLPPRTGVGCSGCGTVCRNRRFLFRLHWLRIFLLRLLRFLLRTAHTCCAAHARRGDRSPLCRVAICCRLFRSRCRRFSRRRLMPHNALTCCRGRTPLAFA